MCNKRSGQCRCYREVTGRTCDTCAMEGYYGPINRRCRMCNCHPNNTEECVKVSAWWYTLQCHVITFYYRGLAAVNVAEGGVVLHVMNVSL